MRQEIKDFLATIYQVQKRGKLDNTGAPQAGMQVGCARQTESCTVHQTEKFNANENIATPGDNTVTLLRASAINQVNFW